MTCGRPAVLRLGSNSQRPSYFTKKNVGEATVRLCKDIIDEAWSNPAFLKEQKLVCGNDKQWVFAHKRGNKTVAGHRRNVAAPRPRTKKTKLPVDPREKELATLIRRRDGQMRCLAR